jgi:hypothetical protein
MVFSNDHSVSILRSKECRVENRMNYEASDRGGQNDLGLKTPDVYNITCECGKLFIGKIPVVASRPVLTNSTATPDCINQRSQP